MLELTIFWFSKSNEAKKNPLPNTLEKQFSNEQSEKCQKNCLSTFNYLCNEVNLLKTDDFYKKYVFTSYTLYAITCKGLE